jgi:AraC-like DNA-binding protein
LALAVRRFLSDPARGEAAFMGKAASVGTAAAASGSTVAAGFVRALIGLAVAKGADRDALVRRAGLETEDLQDPDRRIPFGLYVALMRAGQELAGDPALALHFGEAFDITELSIVGLMGQACETVADAFDSLSRFTRLAADVELEEEANGQRLVLSRRGGELWLVDMRKNPNDFPELTESSLARMAASSRRFPGGPFIKAIRFTHEEPAYRDEYDRIFGVPLTFGSDRNEVLMNGDGWMQLKSPFPSRYVFDILKERAEGLLEAMASEPTMQSKVEKMLMPILHGGDATMTNVAARLGLGRSTLSRRLKAEGTSFEKVLDGLRRRLATDYLSGRGLSVNETAYLVGFSDPAAFSRAFKRWTGLSPRAARREGVAIITKSPVFRG